MNWFYNLKIGKKLLVSFGVVLLLMLCACLYLVSSMKKIDKDYNVLISKKAYAFAYSEGALGKFNQSAANLRQYIIDGNPDNVEKLRKNMSVGNERIKNIAPLLETEEGKKLFSNFQDRITAFEQYAEHVISLVKSREAAGGAQRAAVEKQLLDYLGSNTGIVANMADAGEAVASRQEQRIEAGVEENDASVGKALMVSVAVSTIGVIFSFCIALFIARVISRPMSKLTEAADKVACGDININIESETRDEIGILSKSFKIMIDTIKSLLNETDSLIKAIQEGKLDIRGKSAAFAGAWSEQVSGINKLIDAFVAPFNVTAEYVERISKGDVPPKITDTYYGDFNEIKNNLNKCLEAVDGLVNETLMLSSAAVDGRLNTRGDVSKFEGKFKDIVKGINDTLDAVITPINEAAGCLKEMARGNIDVNMTGNYQGDHAIIKNALNSTLEALNEILSHISTAIDQVNIGAHQVSDSSQMLAQGAAESASSMEQVTSSMHQINAQTKLNAENAVQANQLATQARGNAEKGNDQMVQMVKAMGDINESANNISKIIKAIDEIAFQTNLLALNAAVEAARAGKHGKGFTVVAEEVRNLAQRSAKAAKETAEMIEGSIKKTEVGTRIAEDTSKALGEIVLGVTKVTDFISEIASASKEQSLGIDQINQGLVQLDQVTQQNSAGAEELAAASQEMSGQAVTVKEILGKFKLSQQGSGPMAGTMSGGIPQNMHKKARAAGQQYAAQGHTTDGFHKPVMTAASEVAVASAAGPRVRPDEIISLDDMDYGKF